MTDTTTIELLRKARDRVAVAWCKWELSRDPDGVGPDRCPVCAVGALNWATSGSPTVAGIGRNEALSVLNAVLPGRHGVVSTYNDVRRRRQADVIALYDRAMADVSAVTP